MGILHIVIIVGLMLWSLPNAALASIAWLSDVRQAQQIAHEQQRVVLLHFYADWCQPCVYLDREVYPREEISSAISANFVPVKIDGRRSPELVRHYGVQSFPTDIFLDPSGRVLLRTTSPTDPGKYLQLLNQMAASRSQSPQQNLPTANSPLPSEASNPNPGYQMPPHQMAAQAAIPGDPDRYSPVLSGYDPTRFIDFGESVLGKREHGMRFRGRIYLFAEEATLERFQRSPEHYAQRSHEIMMRGARR
jgi:thioredoxin-related protein/YHS domain-containing protein